MNFTHRNEEVRAWSGRTDSYFSACMSAGTCVLLLNIARQSQVLPDLLASLYLWAKWLAQIDYFPSRNNDIKEAKVNAPVWQQEEVQGQRVKHMIEKENNFYQAGERYRSFDPARQDRFIEHLVRRSCIPRHYFDGLMCTSNICSFSPVHR